ncbi:MAG TPA: glucuronate isomerase [Flavihumibacter sp.]|nr:glucuronate isomerase [Flavihumibacter sp.]
MKAFLHDDFLLQSPAAILLYHDYAANMPIIDYHNHLPAQQIADDICFNNLTQAWLQGDHYKWRAMRTHGVAEKCITGDASDRDKFLQWAATVPYTVRNPLFHWTHLELKRYFGIDELLTAETAGSIYDRCSEMLQSPLYSVRNLLQMMKVKLVCTTDDPADTLGYHIAMRQEGAVLKMLPAFRPDMAMKVEDPVAFGYYLQKISEVSGSSIHTLDDYMKVLKSRHEFFAAVGCSVSDHGLEEIYAEVITNETASALFDKLLAGMPLNQAEIRQLKSWFLYAFATWDHASGWVQQYHLGALRNNNKRMLQALGPDTGWDSIGDWQQASALSRFLNRLDEDNTLAKTILYNLNPADNALMATMIGNFNDGSVAGKIQWGSAWWFLDQKEGMVNQLNTLSNMSLISQFVGMLTDSRSFLSFPRHEYFRRLLCNLFGQDMENGELPNDFNWMGGIIQDICFNNARDYFGWKNYL